MCLTNVADEKRRRALERVFFHDVRNVLGALLGYLQLSAEGLVDSDHSARVLAMAQCLADEISSFEELLRAESGELHVQLQPLNLAEVCREAAELVQQHEVAAQRRIVLVAPADVTLSSDVRMVRRILVNLLKNALEASRSGGRVTLDWGVRGDEAVIRVHNDGFIPREVQLQIFQRSFSTKGPGRGLGTYSVRLFAETFLKGRVSVNSCPEEGTTFTVCLPRG
jgi:signal transduction histidine kinase